MIRTLRLFLSGVIVGFMGAWWFRPQWDDAQTLIAAINDAGMQLADAVRSMSQEGPPDGEETRGAA